MKTNEISRMLKKAKFPFQELIKGLNL